MPGRRLASTSALYFDAFRILIHASLVTAEVGRLWQVASQARSSLTQVLLFKFRAEQAAFRASSAKLSIDRSSLMEVQPAIRTKIRAYQADYVSSVKDL